VRQVLDNAMWTFERRCKLQGKDEGGLTPAAVGKLRESVAADFAHDTGLRQRETLVGMLKLCIMPRLNSLIGERCKSLLEPIESGIPDDMKDFVDPFEVR
jgi:hypothetical protein